MSGTAVFDWAVLRVKVGDERNPRHLSLLVPWKRCEVVK